MNFVTNAFVLSPKGVMNSNFGSMGHVTLPKCGIGFIMVCMLVQALINLCTVGI